VQIGVRIDSLRLDYNTFGMKFCENFCLNLICIKSHSGRVRPVGEVAWRIRFGSKFWFLFGHL